MKLKYLVTVAAASALMGGAALAQPSDSTDTSSTDTSVQTETSVTTSTDNSSSTQAVTSVSATTVGSDASVTTTLVTNGPVPDTAENRAKYGGPMSHAGKMTKPAGN